MFQTAQEFHSQIFKFCWDILGSHLIGCLWVSLIIDQSECLICCFLYTELTLFCTELHEHCIYLNQSELSNFSMYISKLEKNILTCYKVDTRMDDIQHSSSPKSKMVSTYQSRCVCCILETNLRAISRPALFTVIYSKTDVYVTSNKNKHSQREENILDLYLLYQKFIPGRSVTSNVLTNVCDSKFHTCTLPLYKLASIHGSVGWTSTHLTRSDRAESLRCKQEDN